MAHFVHHVYNPPPTTLYRFRCDCTGEREEHELVTLGYLGMSMPPVWVEQGSHYRCLRCGKKTPYVAPKPKPPSSPQIIDLDMSD